MGYFFGASLFLVLLLLPAATTTPVWALLAPEVPLERIASTQEVLNRVFGVAGADELTATTSSSEEQSWEERRRQALDVSASDGAAMEMPDHMTVYGELGIDALVTILDAVGVEKGDEFLDIGSGDGTLVSGAAMMFAEYLEASRGIEILPTLYNRSLKFQHRVEMAASEANLPICCKTELFQGDIFQPTAEIKNILDTSNLAVCFATTWSRGEPGRKLPQLSKALGRNGVASLSPKSKLVIIDGVLDERDGFVYHGKFKLQCPDTAPYSLARLYVRS